MGTVHHDLRKTAVVFYYQDHFIGRNNIVAIITNFVYHLIDEIKVLYLTFCSDYLFGKVVRSVPCFFGRAIIPFLTYWFIVEREEKSKGATFIQVAFQFNSPAEQICESARDRQ